MTDLDPPNYQREISLAQARNLYGRPLVAATLAHLRTPEWPEGTTIAAHFFDLMKSAVEAYHSKHSHIQGEG